jgi:hypothetical protein
MTPRQFDAWILSPERAALAGEVAAIDPPNHAHLPRDLLVELVAALCVDLLALPLLQVVVLSRPLGRLDVPHLGGYFCARAFALLEHLARGPLSPSCSPTLRHALTNAHPSPLPRLLAAKHPNDVLLLLPSPLPREDHYRRVETGRRREIARRLFDDRPNLFARGRLLAFYPDPSLCLPHWTSYLPVPLDRDRAACSHPALAALHAHRLDQMLNR